jgi:3-deoxy-D-manno-octulosonic acid (KDO) 8-phosphate synthase
VSRQTVKGKKKTKSYFEFHGLNVIAANEQVLPMVGKLKNLRLATEVHYLFKD